MNKQTLVSLVVEYDATLGDVYWHVVSANLRSGDLCYELVEVYAKKSGNASPSEVYKTHAHDQVSPAVARRSFAVARYTGDELNAAAGLVPRYYCAEPQKVLYYA